MKKTTTKNRREITTKNCIDVEKNEFETFARFFDRIFETTNDYIKIEIVISIEKNEFEIFVKCHALIELIHNYTKISK